MSWRGRHVHANGIRLHYVEVGTGGPALVILPGITMTAVTWAFVAERLADLGRVIVVDPRGRGLSERGPHLRYALADYAHDTLGLIAALGLEAPAIVGHSMGARIAIRTAAIAPAGTLGPIVLADPPVTGPGRRPYPTPLSVYLDSIAATSRGEGYAALREQLGWSPEHLNLRMQWLPTCDPVAVTESYRSFVEEDIHADLPRIACDTLLLYAGHGGTVTDEDAAEIMTLLPRGRRLRIDGAGHMIPWDDLDAFCAGVGEFLAPRGFTRTVAKPSAS